MPGDAIKIYMEEERCGYKIKDGSETTYFHYAPQFILYVVTAPGEVRAPIGEVRR